MEFSPPELLSDNRVGITHIKSGKTGIGENLDEAKAEARRLAQKAASPHKSMPNTTNEPDAPRVMTPVEREALQRIKTDDKDEQARKQALDETAGVTFSVDQYIVLIGWIWWLSGTDPRERHAQIKERIKQTNKNLKRAADAATDLLEVLQPIQELSERAGPGREYVLGGHLTVSTKLSPMLKELATEANRSLSVNERLNKKEAWKRLTGQYRGYRPEAAELEPVVEAASAIWHEAGGQGRGCSMPNTYEGRYTGGIFELTQELYRQSHKKPPTGRQIEHALDKVLAKKTTR